MIAPAAFWGGAVPAMSNATQEDIRSALLPTLPESAMLGAMFAKHEHGLHSGGLIGYTTLFTGYNPEMGHGGLARSISIGRLANQGITMAARGIKGSGLITNEAALDWLTRFTHTNRFGLAGVLSSVSQQQIKTATASASDYLVQREVGTKTWRTAHRAAPKTGTALSPGAPRAETVRKAKLDALRQVRAARQRMAPQLASEAPKLGRAAAVQVGRRWSFFTGLMGLGADKFGQPAVEWAARGDHLFPVAKKGSRGAMLVKGRGGAIAGTALRAGAWLAVASFAADIVVDKVGDAYAAAVRTTERLQDRFNMHGPQLSPAYMNNAAVTERQRAMLELNQSVLNPRTQLMGNEAGLYHR